MPALLAAARLITLEINTERSRNASGIFQKIIKGNVSKEGENKITIALDFDAPKDEGDFGAYELIIGTLMAIDTDVSKNKTDNERFADAVGTIISMLEEDEKLKNSFIGKTYIPFMRDLKLKGYVKEFAYLVLQQGGDDEAYKWLVDNGQNTIDFINWAKSYQLAQ